MMGRQDRDPRQLFYEFIHRARISPYNWYCTVTHVWQRIRVPSAAGARGGFGCYLLIHRGAARMF
jgi:hypothetical protein